jgi:tight adherence protein B
MELQIAIVSLLFGLSGFLLTPSLQRGLSRLIAWFERRVDRSLVEMFVFDVTPRTITLIVAGVSAVCILLLLAVWPGPLSVILGALIGVCVPLFVIQQLGKRRRAKLEMQLLDALITLANGMRAGLNLGQAMALVEKHGEKPVSQEFGLIIREIDHGTSVDVALDNASRRLRSHNYRLLFSAMKTTRTRGGNMPVTLDRLGESLRNIVALEEKVKAQTAQGRTSAVVMGIMPAVILGIYYLIDSHGVSLLFTEPIGQGMLAVSLMINIAGFLWIRKIVAFDI